jgi:hypothetical protein
MANYCKNCGLPLSYEDVRPPSWVNPSYYNAVDKTCSCRATAASRDSDNDDDDDPCFWN